MTLQSQFRGKSTRKRLVRQRNAEARGLWAVLRLQAIYRGNLARAKSQALRRALIAKRFEDQMAAEKKKKERMALLEKQLEANPDLFNTLAGLPPAPAPPPAQPVRTSAPPSQPRSAPKPTAPAAAASVPSASNKEEINNLKAEILSLQNRIRTLEDENAALRKGSKALSLPSSSPSLAAASLHSSRDLDDWRAKTEALERENMDLRRQLLARKASDTGGPPVSSPSFTRSETYAAPGSQTARIDAKDRIQRRISISQNDPRASVPKPLMSQDSLDDSSPQGDWMKKFSDQHQRVYWKHKVTGKTSWSDPTTTTESAASSSATSPIVGDASVSLHMLPSTSTVLQTMASGAGGAEGGLSASDLSIATEKLMTGWVGLKLSTSNYPKERTIVIEPSTQILSWKKGTSAGAKVDGSLNLDSVKRITRGRKSRVLEKVKGVDANLCLSVHYLNTSLDIQLASETERDMMYFGLKELVKIN